MDRMTVLTVDDHLDFREGLKSLLEREAFSVVACRDSREARAFEPGNDYVAVVVDSSGFAHAKETKDKLKGFPVIVLSNRPETASFPADGSISKADSEWPAKVVERLRACLDDSIPPMVCAAQAAFVRDLNELLKTHYRQWVAYRGDQQAGFSDSETELYEKCLRQGFRKDEFVVRSVEPVIPDRELKIPGGVERSSEKV